MALSLDGGRNILRGAEVAAQFSFWVVRVKQTVRVVLDVSEYAFHCGDEGVLKERFRVR